MEPSVVSLAEALSLAHDALHRDLEELQRALRSPQPSGPATLATRLGLLQKHLLEHFRFEEQNGYMDVVLRREPRLERVVQHLCEQHRGLARTLAGLLSQAEAATDTSEGFCNAVRGWIEELRQHESQENRLFAEAFNLDIGDKD
jgi:hypothetical protein